MMAPPFPVFSWRTIVRRGVRVARYSRTWTVRSVEPSSTQMTRLMYRLRSRLTTVRAMHGSSLKAGTIASIDPMFRLGGRRNSRTIRYSTEVTDMRRKSSVFIDAAHKTSL